MRKHTRRVAVVGGAGYLGSILCEHLIMQGLDVCSFDAHWFGENSLRPLRGHPRFKAWTIDARNTDEMEPLLRGCDAVVALGGIVGDGACHFDIAFTRSCNYRATVDLARLCRRIAIPRFVFASSCSVYGRSGSAAGRLTEQSATHPVSYYAQDKLECEVALRGMAGAKFHPTILRFATLFGWSRRMRFDLVVNLLTAKACGGQLLQIYGGRQRRPFLHVRDCAAAIMDVLNVDLRLVSNAVFNVGSNDNNHEIIDIAAFVRRTVPSASVDIIDGVIDQRDYDVDFTKFAVTIGFRKMRSVLDGIEEIRHALGSGKIHQIDDPIYVNEKRVRQLVCELQAVAAPRNTSYGC